MGSGRNFLGGRDRGLSSRRLRGNGEWRIRAVSTWGELVIGLGPCARKSGHQLNARATTECLAPSMRDMITTGGSEGLPSRRIRLWEGNRATTVRKHSKISHPGRKKRFRSVSFTGPSYDGRDEGIPAAGTPAEGPPRTAVNAHFGGTCWGHRQGAVNRTTNDEIDVQEEGHQETQTSSGIGRPRLVRKTVGGPLKPRQEMTRTAAGKKSS